MQFNFLGHQNAPKSKNFLNSVAANTRGFWWSNYSIKEFLVTNSEFLIPISLQRYVLDLTYFFELTLNLSTKYQIDQILGLEN